MNLYIVAFKHGTGWHPIAGDCVTTLEDAVTIIKAEKLKGATNEFAILRAEVMAE